MKIYDLKIDKPAWFYDPPTNRQLKVLKFFGKSRSADLTKGVASGMIFRLFSEDTKRELWEKYVYVTGDENDCSPDLAPFDMGVLGSIEIPVDWFPQHAKRRSRNQRERQREIVAEMLVEGSPFDDPVPEIVFQGKHFAFTETFECGSRNECVAVAAQLGCLVDDPVKAVTDYLVIGSKAKNRITNKIVSAMIRRMDTGNPRIISESDWVYAVQHNTALG